MKMLKYLTSSLRTALIKIAELSKQDVKWDFVDAYKPTSGGFSGVIIVKIEPQNDAQAAIIAAIGNSAAVKYGQKTQLLGEPKAVALAESFATSQAAPVAKKERKPKKVKEADADNAEVGADDEDAEVGADDEDAEENAK